MKILKCIICGGEVDILEYNGSINKKIKCRCCGFNNLQTQKKKEPEVVIIRKRT